MQPTKIYLPVVPHQVNYLLKNGLSTISITPDVRIGIQTSTVVVTFTTKLEDAQNLAGQNQPSNATMDVLEINVEGLKLSPAYRDRVFIVDYPRLEVERLKLVPRLSSK